MMRRDWSGLLRRLGRAVWRALQMEGYVWLGMPLVAAQLTVDQRDHATGLPPREPGAAGIGPVRGHPERLAAREPPSELERRLWRELEQWSPDVVEWSLRTRTTRPAQADCER